jgi:hypothetical protein
MRARRLLPAALVLAVLVVLSGCANGSGLRVEGADAPATSSTPSPSANRGFAPTTTPSPTLAPRVSPEAMNLTEIRDSLRNDTQLDPYFRKLMSRCTVIARCLTRGPAVDTMKTGQPQQVVLIHTLDNFIVGAALMAATPKGPRRVWSLKADQLKISPTRQGDLVVESQIFAVDDAPCCPSGSAVEVYRWVGGQMTKVSSQIQEGD